jgi:hypothetical protein
MITSQLSMYPRTFGHPRRQSVPAPEEKKPIIGKVIGGVIGAAVVVAGISLLAPKRSPEIPEVRAPGTALTVPEKPAFEGFALNMGGTFK